MVLGEKSYLAIIFIATHCKFVHVCPWSFGNLSLPWINQQWVPQVVFYIHYTTYFIRINIFNSHLSYLISDFKWKKNQWNENLSFSLGLLHLRSWEQYKAYLINVQCCYRWFGCETIHPTQDFTSMNLFLVRNNSKLLLQKVMI